MGLAMQNIDIESLSLVTGGVANPAKLRNAVTVLKSAHPDALKLGGVSYDLEHAGAGAMTKLRGWLGGKSINGRLDQIMSTWER